MPVKNGNFLTLVTSLQAVIATAKMHVKPNIFAVYSAPDRSRTDGLTLRRRSLYPTELPGHTVYSEAIEYYSIFSLKKQVIFLKWHRINWFP